MTATETLVADFLATLNAYVAERINARLRDALAISLVAVPRARRRYTKTAKWHAAQRARRAA